MTIDMTIVDRKRAERLNRINTLATSRNIPTITAAMYVDQNAPYTTNHLMLNEAGFKIGVVTLDNYLDVINALQCIGVTVLYDKVENNPGHIVKVLNDVITEEVPECWGGPDMQEIVDINPVSTV